jgi:hypothetical protein
MSAIFDWESESQGDTGGNGSGNNDGGSNPLREAREAYKALKAKYKELEQENSTLKVQSRQNTIRDALASKGVNPKVAALVPADIEPTEEAVTGWLTDYADVLGIQVESQPAEGVSADQAEQLGQIQAFNRGNASPPPNAAQTLEARIAAATTKAELDQILKDFG